MPHLLSRNLCLLGVLAAGFTDQGLLPVDLGLGAALASGIGVALLFLEVLEEIEQVLVVFFARKIANQLVDFLKAGRRWFIL